MDKNDNIFLDGIDERIESFLRGTMSPEEEIAFKKEVKANPELRNHAMAMTSLIRGIQSKNTTKEESILHEKPTESKLRSMVLWACSVAAVFAFLFGIYQNKKYNMLRDTVSPYYTEYDTDDISRGDADSLTTVHLYTLFSQIQKERYMSSYIQELEPIYQSLDNEFTYHPWANDIAWNLALAYVKDNQVNKAITILNKLKQDNPDTPISIKAEELLRKLQAL